MANTRKSPGRPAGSAAPKRERAHPEEQVSVGLAIAEELANPHRQFPFDYSPLRFSLNVSTDSRLEGIEGRILRDAGTGDHFLSISDLAESEYEPIHLPLDAAREYVRRLTRLIETAEQSGLDCGDGITVLES